MRVAASLGWRDPLNRTASGIQLSLQIHAVVQDAQYFDHALMAIGTKQQQVPPLVFFSSHMQRADSLTQFWPMSNTHDGRPGLEGLHRAAKDACIGVGLSRAKMLACPAHDLDEVGLGALGQADPPAPAHVRVVA